MKRDKTAKLFCTAMAITLSMSMLAGCGKTADTSATESSTEEGAEVHDGVDTSVLTYQNINDVVVYADDKEIKSFDKTAVETYADLSTIVDNANDVTYKITVNGYSDSQSVSTLGLVYDNEIMSVSYDAATAIQAKYGDYLEMDDVLGEYCLTLYMTGGDLMTAYNTEQLVVTGTVEDEAAKYVKMTFSDDGKFVVTSDKDMEISVGVYINDVAHSNEGMYFKTYEIVKGVSEITVSDIIDEYNSEADSFSTEEPAETVEETESAEN